MKKRTGSARTSKGRKMETRMSNGRNDSAPPEKVRERVEAGILFIGAN
jgi:hypothetical protein